MTTAAAIYETLVHGSTPERLALLDVLGADAGMKATIGPLLAGDNPGMPIVALGLLAMRYCAGQNPELGSELAFALHRRGIELFEANEAPGLQLTTLSLLAFQHANAGNLLGRSAAVISFAGDWIPFYEARHDTTNLPSLKVERITALLNSNLIDEAGNALRDPTLRGSGVADIAIVRLDQKLADIKASITAMKTEPPAAAGSPADTYRTYGRAVRDLEHAALDPAGATDIADILKQLPAMPTGTPDPESFRTLLDELEHGEAVLTGGSTADSQWTIKRRIREAAGIFVLVKEPSPEQLTAALNELEPCLTWANDHGEMALANDALWALYLCHNRLHNPARAADVLIELRRNLESRRQGIADPLQRGGVFAEYSYLFDALCEKLHQAGRTVELLEAIEAAKGRGVADILTRKAGRPIADADVNAAAGMLPALAVAHRFHYLTFHVDEACSYAVMVTREGHVLPSVQIALGHRDILDAAAHADPRDWNQPSDEDPSVRIADASRTLAPLVGWLQPLIDAGHIARGDHLCFAADQELANVPLHYLRLGTATLGDHVTVSKTHGAFHLQRSLNGNPAAPRAFLGVVVPTRQNVAQASWPAMRQAMWRPIEWLQAHLSGESVADEHADFARVSALDLTQRLVHFSTHAVFPRTRSPFERSGVVLADAGELPDETAVASASNLDAVMTPGRVIDSALDLRGSHVSLMSCVSGLSREGRGGDALGLEWALIQAGATSLLASHWYISARLAADFFERFYQHWLVDGMSRAAAHSMAIADIRGSAGEDAAHAWAAFSLIGDWR
jgi:CHAT domain-containing protein